jgi:succinoglycan biosynthesis transport protein ExoP
MDMMKNTDHDVIDLREILAVLRKRFWAIVVITLAALAAGYFLANYMMVPIYRTDATLMVTQAATQGVGGKKGNDMEGLVDTISQLPQMTINTYLGQLKSEAVMQKVVEKLKLDKIGYSAKGLSGSIDVQSLQDSNLIKVTVTHTNPLMAAQIANTLTQEFLGFISQTNEQQVSKSMDFLKQQAATSGDELKKATANLNSLQSQARGVDMLDKLMATKAEDLSKYQSLSLQEGLEYQKALAGLKQVNQQLKDTPEIISIATFDEVTGKSSVEESINPSYTLLKSMYNEKSVIAAEKGVVAKNLQRIINNLTEELKTLQAEVGQKKNLLQNANNEVTRLQETNSLLRTKLDETNISKSVKFGETNLMVVSPATVPRGPFAPNKPKIISAAFAAGLIASICLAFLLNYFDNTIKTQRDLEAILGVPVLGLIPSYNLDKPEAIGRY